VPSTARLTRSTIATTATAVLVALSIGTPAAAAPPDRTPGGPAPAPGNRGSIRLSGPGDAGPGHTPHLGCGDILIRASKLAGDEGTWEIRSWPPTGDRAIVATGAWEGPDGDGDGDGDVVAVVDGATLSAEAAASGIPAHDRQGRHFKITLVQEPGVKHKSFWVDCGAAAAPDETAEPQAQAGEAGTEVAGVVTVPAPAALEAPAPAPAGDVTMLAAGQDAAAAVGDDGTMVLGTHVARPDALPLTGGNWAAIVLTGMLLTGTGTFLTRRAGRRGDDDATAGS
jgi:hypothetical protein